VRKVALAPGAEQVVTLELGKEDLASFEVRLNRWTTEPGMYRALVGTSAGDIRLTGWFKALCANPHGYGPMTGIGRLLSLCQDGNCNPRHGLLESPSTARCA
jgi:beta-glucosidase